MLAASVPLVATLHDAWLLTGHCAHPLDSDGWQRGCGRCPHLDTYPPLRRDGTAYNLRRKRAIYAQLQLTVVTPCASLMAMVEESVLAPAARIRRVIPHGVDLELFRPTAERVAPPSPVPPDHSLVVFAAQGGRQNQFKDFDTLEAALSRLAATRAKPLTVVALGGAEEELRLGSVTLRSVPSVTRERVADWLRAADLYVHAARAETFPLAVLEALASGTPVIATRTGGIPEQVRSLGESPEPTGVLVDQGDDVALAGAMERLLDDQELRLRLADTAVRDAHSRFGVERQVQAYLDLYEEVLEAAPRPGIAAVRS